MKKIFASFAFIALFLLSFLIPSVFPTSVFAANDENCISAEYYPYDIYENSPLIQFAFYLIDEADRTAATGQYVVKADDGKTVPGIGTNLDYVSEVILFPEWDAGRTQYRITGAISNPKWSRQYDTRIPHILTLYRLSAQPNYKLGVIPNGDGLTFPYCSMVVNYKVVKPITPTPKQEKCELIPPAKNLTVNDNIEITAVVNPPPPAEIATSWVGNLTILDKNKTVIKTGTNDISTSGATTTIYNKLYTIDKPGLYTINYTIFKIIPDAHCQTVYCPLKINKGSCQIMMNIAPPGGIGGFITMTPTPFVTAIPTQAFGEPTYTPTPVVVIPTLGPLCEQLTDKNSKDDKEQQRYGDCMKCVDPKPTDPKITPVPGIWSAIGCLPTDYGKLISDYVFTTGTGLAGGISFLYFLYGAFLILTSAGNPEKIEEAKQIIISALSGVLLIIFSIFLLRVIGVDILRIPGFK